MAKLINYQFTASMLSRGASGKVPSRELVKAYAKACDATQQTLCTCGRLPAAPKRNSGVVKKRPPTSRTWPPRSAPPSPTQKSSRPSASCAGP
ncbi:MULTISPECIES: hypothetical protein [Streptomyces]